MTDTEQKLWRAIMRMELDIHDYTLTIQAQREEIASLKTRILRYCMPGCPLRGDFLDRGE